MKTIINILIFLVLFFISVGSDKNINKYYEWSVMPHLIGKQFQACYLNPTGFPWIIANVYAAFAKIDYKTGEYTIKDYFMKISGKTYYESFDKQERLFELISIDSDWDKICLVGYFTEVVEDYELIMDVSGYKKDKVYTPFYGINSKMTFKKSDWETAVYIPLILKPSKVQDKVIKEDINHAIQKLIAAKNDLKTFKFVLFGVIGFDVLLVIIAAARHFTAKVNLLEDDQIS